MGRTFDLLASRDSGPKRTVQWTGNDGEDASRRYVDCHRDATVFAWRRHSEPSIITVLGKRQDYPMSFYVKRERDGRIGWTGPIRSLPLSRLAVSGHEQLRSLDQRRDR